MKAPSKSGYFIAPTNHQRRGIILVAATAFNDNVAARTRAAQQILGAPDLKARYLDLGGLEADLDVIVQTGLAAEALNHAQSDAKSTGKNATVEVLQTFEALQQEYSLVMGIARAIRGDLTAERAATTIIQRLDDIIKNEAQVTVTIEEKADGTVKRKASRKVSQEALRAEIEKDAAALAEFSEIGARLRARRCDRARLDALRETSRSLSGKLGDRVVKKGSAKVATKEETEMVAAQRLKWGSVYRLLSAVANEDQRVASLLHEAGRKRTR